MSRFCRHNRLTTQCPICSKGTVLEPARRRPARAPSRSSRKGRTAAAPTPSATRLSHGPYVAAGPYEDGCEVRLERVPGGLRLAAWEAGRIARRAPALEARDLAPLLEDAARKDLMEAPPMEAGAAAGVGDHGASSGRSGELRDELRVERLDGERVRIARWILRPNAGWELQEAPVMLPPARFTEALAAAARKGVLGTSGPEE